MSESSTPSLLTIGLGIDFFVEDLQGPGDVVERLEELGFAKGEGGELLQQLPSGGATIVRIANRSVALRTEEAECVKVRLG